MTLWLAHSCARLSFAGARGRQSSNKRAASHLPHISEAMTATYIPSAARPLYACSFVICAWTCCVAFAAAQQPNPSTGGRHFDHVVMVVMENQGSRQALADPNIAALVKAGAGFSNYPALPPPSAPTITGLVGGIPCGVDRDHVAVPIKAPTIVARLE